jgi:site-specific DNA-cytosine methylase
VIIRHLAWEIDSACVEITKKNHADVEHRGDFTRDDASLVAESVRKDLALGTLLASAAPPCLPWSRIDGGQDTGCGSLEEKKFELAFKFISEIESKLGTREKFLIENVVFKDHSAVEPFEKMCGGKAAVCDATDFGVIRRPRLLWTRADVSDKNLSSLPHPLQQDEVGQIRRVLQDCTKSTIRHLQARSIVGTTWFLPNRSSQDQRDSRASQIQLCGLTA